MEKEFSKCFLGIDLGGTKAEIGVVNVLGEVITSRRIETRAEEGAGKILSRMDDLIEDILRQAGLQAKDLSGVGIGIPGSFDQKTNRIHTLTNLQGWEGIFIKDHFNQLLSLPVEVNNDANAAALGEYLFGNGRGCGSMVYVTISTGVGGGIIMNGRLQNGAWGTAGEVGHMVLDPQGERCGCGNKGCWESISSGTAIERTVRRRLDAGEESLLSSLTQDGRIKAADVFRARDLGDPLALEVTDKALFYNGIGVVNLVNILNPERVVIGGGVASGVGAALFDTVRKVVRDMAFGNAGQVEIVPAFLGGRTGVVGAAALAFST